MPTKPPSVDAYLEAQPPERRAHFERIRAQLQAALPHAEEAISYGMPAYLVGGRAVASFAGWKANWALYVPSQQLFSTVTTTAPTAEAGKGILRWPYGEELPEETLKELSAWRP